MPVTFTTDSYFHIGQMHLIQGKPCQDYATASVFGNIALAVVSDGCSSGGNTDFGSRFIVLAVLAAIRKQNHVLLENPAKAKELKEVVTSKQEEVIRSACETFGLEINDMLATSNYACLTPAGGFIHLRGDGVVACAKKNGEIKMTCYRWNENTPLYPAYSDDDYKSFIDCHGGDPAIKALRIESWEFAADRTLINAKDELVSISEGIQGAFHFYSKEELEGMTFMAVFTDGVMQVGNVVGGGSDFMDWKDVVFQLMSFKSLAGEFAKRRIIRFLKDQQKLGKVPLDDIAYAVVQVTKGD